VSRTAPRPLSQALARFSGALTPASTLARVQEVWEDAVGPAIAAEAQPTAERDGVLTVVCAAAVWSQELDLMAEAVLARLNAAMGPEHIRELRCRTG
jgi:predicted nucleic acid-binding Zn ribbon protein